MKTTLIVLFFLAVTTSAYAAEDFDFALIASDCKSTVSFLRLDEKSLQTVLAEKPIFFCKRNSKVLTCNLSYQNSNQKTEIRKYAVISDAPPIFAFATENNAELALVNTTEMAAAYTSRVFDEKYMGYKVCSMAFMTQDQYIALGKNKN